MPETEFPKASQLLSDKDTRAIGLLALQSSTFYAQPEFSSLVLLAKSHENHNALYRIPPKHSHVQLISYDFVLNPIASYNRF